MALVTGLPSFRAQEVIKLRGMGIVTGSAISGFDRLVHYFSAQIEVLFQVAANTKSLAVLLEDQFPYEAMPQMALFAISLIKDVVKIFP
jgi:hypothetical protein